ncbi:MAG: STAS domain-containing protein [Pirellulaceae bacterium]|nr:STAS domain-containing protein [Pirellulaceae bacterium]
MSRVEDDVLIAQFRSPRILAETQIAQIGRELQDLAGQAAGNVLLDFQGVNFMSSSMIGKIILLNKKCSVNGTEVAMCNLSPSVMEVFEITHLNKIFRIHNTAEDAMSHLAGAC